MSTLESRRLVPISTDTRYCKVRDCTEEAVTTRRGVTANLCSHHADLARQQVSERMRGIRNRQANLGLNSYEGRARAAAPLLIKAGRAMDKTGLERAEAVRQWNEALRVLRGDPAAA